MAFLVWIVSAVGALVWNSLRVLVNICSFFRLCFRSPSAVAAENLFLRKQLGLYIERKTKPRRATDCVRFTLAQLSRFFDWRNALTIVKPDTLIRWHREGFRLFWKWKSRPRGRPRIPAALQKLIREMATRLKNSGPFAEFAYHTSILAKHNLERSLHEALNIGISGSARNVGCRSVSFIWPALYNHAWKKIDILPSQYGDR